MVHADGAGLVSAAVRAATLAKVHRGTVSAVAAALVSAVLGAHLKAATQTRSARSELELSRETERSEDVGAPGNPAALLEALRAARVSERRKKDRRRSAKTTSSQIPMRNSDHRGPHGHGHLRQGLPGGIIPHHRNHGDSHHNLHHLTSQHTS